VNDREDSAVETNDPWWTTMSRLSAGQIADARAMFEFLLAKDPSHLNAHLKLAEIAWRQGSPREAAARVLQLADMDVTDAALACEIIAALLQTGETARAWRGVQDWSSKPDLSGPICWRLADLCRQLGRHVEALALLDRALDKGFDNWRVRLERGQALLSIGLLDQAEQDFARSLEYFPTCGRAALAMSRLRTQTRQDNHLADLAERLSHVEPGTLDHAALEFSRYKELEDIGSHAEAWDALAHANEIMSWRNPHDEKWEVELLKESVARFRSATSQEDPIDEGPLPIFIVGLPRSGTTVLERLLGAHSKVASAGELPELARQLYWCADDSAMSAGSAKEVFDATLLGRRYLHQTRWRAEGKPFFIDKQPSNWMFAGLIRRALPHARILHVRRKPIEVCFSNYRAFFGDSYPYSYDLRAIAKHYRKYRELLDYWNKALPGEILEVSYDQLVYDPEPVMRSVLNFCGLGWEHACLRLDGNSTPVVTQSAVQVRQPLHRRAREAWKPYSEQLARLRKEIAQSENQEP